jgi:hypothetical protein
MGAKGLQAAAGRCGRGQGAEAEAGHLAWASIAYSIVAVLHNSAVRAAQRP